MLGASTGTPITSSTHPDQEAWYATSTAVLNWGVPAGTSAIYLSFDKRSNGVGVNPYPASQKERIIRDIKDGVWYFHLTKEQTIGTRETVSYRIAVDTVNPTFTGISESPRTDHSVPNVGIMITASDTGSGIDHYEFILDEGKPSLWTDDGSHTRVLSGVTVGTHALVVVAVDRAGNRASEHLSFTVDNLPTPALTVLNSAFIEGDKIRLSLTSVPTAILDIHVARMNTSPATETFTVDDKGHGEFESALPLSPGSYTVSVVARTATGAISKESDPFVFEVNSSFIGVMKRHPMIPVAIISLILMVIGAYYYLRRMRESSDEEVNYRDSDDEEEVDEYEEEYTPPVREQVQKRPQLREGAVVLGKKEKIQMPATRL